MATYERAYKTYRAEGAYLAAARCARTVGWFRGSLYGDWAVYSGWLERANSLLARGGTGGSESGWLLLADAQRGNELDEQRHQYLEAIEIARTFGDSDLECDALACLGIMLVFSGRADGMRYLDQALAAVDEARAYLKICQEKLEVAKRKIEVRPEAAAPVEEPRDTLV